MPGLGSLTRDSFSKTLKARASAYIIPLKNDGEPDDEQTLRFQYFPESIQDSKAVNWTPREIPGGSLPIYQWISSGERTVTFTAVFTCDLDLLSAQVADDIPNRLESVGQTDRNVDIRAAVAWLRSFMFPTYGAESAVGVPIAEAPQRLLLVFPRGGLGLAGGAASPGGVFVPSGSVGEIEQMLGVMTACDVSWDAFFPSGLPRIASVSLSFVQLGQMPGAPVHFPQADSMRKYRLFEGDRDVTLGYNLKPVLPKK